MTSLARRFYALVEPVAAAAFYAPETLEELAQLGLDTTAGYVMSRAAPMGAVTADVVAATFYTFDARVIRESLRWEVAAPERVLDARTRAAGAAVRRLLTSHDARVAQAAALLQRVVRACDVGGRPLAAAHAALESDDPAVALWLACTTLREHRGDGHVAILVGHGISPAEALLLDGAFNPLKREAYFRFRGFDDARMHDALGRLRSRGYLDENGAFTDGGGKFRHMLEIETDRLAATPYQSLSDSERDELDALMSPLVADICRERAVPRFVAALAGHA